MRASRFSSFQRLALWTTGTTYFLILVGGLVRASGAGLGCPDWPRCFGSWIPPASVPPGFDPSEFNPTLMWTEYLNRLLGVAVGFLILATVISAWRHHRHEPRILRTTIAAFLLTGFQGWLGGQVVANELAAWIVTVHMIVALVIVQLLLYATVRAWRKTAGPFSPIVIVLILVTMIQIGLGTQVRGAVDVALDSGLARASALAAAGLFDNLHRDAAIVVFLGALLVAMRTRLPWAYVVAGLATLQVALGAVVAYVSLEPAAQVGHLTVASLLLGAETVLLLLGRTETPIRSRAT